MVEHPSEANRNVTAAQLQSLRTEMENVTRYMMHNKAGLAQSLYRQLKEEFGYDKLENLPARDLQPAINWIGRYQNIAHRVFDVTRTIEAGFVNAVKSQAKRPDDVYNEMLASLEAPLRQALGGVA